MNELKLYYVMCEDHDTNEKVILQTYMNKAQAESYIANQFERDQNNGFVNAHEYWIETSTMVAFDPDDSPHAMAHKFMELKNG